MYVSLIGLAVITDNPTAENALETLLSDRGRLDEAVAHLTRGACLQPGSLDARIQPQLGPAAQRPIQRCHRAGVEPGPAPGSGTIEKLAEG